MTVIFVRVCECLRSILVGVKQYHSMEIVGVVVYAFSDVSALSVAD